MSLEDMQDSDAVSGPKHSTRLMTVLLMTGALLSKLLGFAREIMMAQVLGASLVADGFRGALTAIFLPLVFLQNESVPAIFIPMHHEAQKRGNAPQFLSALAASMTLMALAIVLAVVALGRWWVDAVVGGFAEEGNRLTRAFVQIMAWGMPASVLLNCLAAAEIATGKTLLTNLRAGLLNVAMIVGLLLLLLTGNVIVLAWSFTAAFNLMAAWAVIVFLRKGMLDPKGLRLSLIAATTGDFLWRLRPLLALPMAEQGQVWIERLLASRLVTGAVASLDYARTLSDSALLLISQPVGLAVMAAHRDEDRRSQLEAVARPILAITLPASAFLFVFAPDLIRLVFMRGAFTEHGVELTSQALRGISVGLWASTLGWILLRSLNSQGRNGLAMLIVVGAYGANISMNLITSSLGAGSGGGMLNLGLGEATRSIVLLAGTTLVLANRRTLGKLIALSLLPAALMAGLGWQIQHSVDGMFPRLAAGCAAGGLSVILGAALLMPDLRQFVARRFRALIVKQGAT